MSGRKATRRLPARQSASQLISRTMTIRMQASIVCQIMNIAVFNKIIDDILASSTRLSLNKIMYW